MPTSALVTGAASGIGRAVVKRFLNDDVVDVVAALDIDPGVHEGFGESVATYDVDVSDHGAVNDVVADIEQTTDITAVVNNAAVSRYFWLGDLGPEEWRDVIDVNLTGQYNVAHAVGPRMYERGKGAVVNVSSTAGQRGSASAGVHYSASKAGVLGLTKGLAKQLAPSVRVNSVVPGLIDTPLTTDSELWSEEDLDAFVERLPAGRLGDPDEVARVIHFLCGEGSAYMTGSVVNVDGGSDLV
ncbi:SDR family NAD(P)-dependent oxidoreductase [Halocalculus aciditolerans]|uniref:3-oxoacyl-[acyl-carrier-protein] reductase FabG n=1 Tax=Halocalculus aciditolerans TaxID=1383812 RepID=A0A830FE24_9EURY|nr:SDR family NAD(P)-dependent oxidoreductase [Halocalculus aciditolerans]GGL66218.1 3-oxoacyl-[acyl-carrier-protein] reductase FabG [Halocalculus aciditolerans]